MGNFCGGLIDYQMFSILLLNEREQVLEIQYSVRFGHPVSPSEKVPLDRGLVGTAVRERRLIHAGDVRKDARYFMVNPETRSEMAVPLLYKGKVIGVLDLEHVRVNYFNDDHQRTLVTLASQIAVAIENARLYQRVTQQEQRLEHDLDMAREVQLRLLPPTAAALSRMPSSPPGFCPRAPSAAISTTFCLMTTTALASRWETSAAKRRRRRCMRR